MSYYNPVVAAGPRRRPGAVSAAGYLLYAVAGLAVIAAGVTFSQLGAIGEVARNTAKPTENPDTLATGAQLGIGGVGVICVLAAIMFVICAVFDLRGRNGMRITTWAVGGLFALCLGCSAIGNGAGATIGATTTSDTSSSSQAIANSLPNWYRISSAALESLAVLLLLVAIILLALPASNPYFRKPDPTLVTMMPGVAYQVPGAAYQMPVYPPAGAPMPPPLMPPQSPMPQSPMWAPPPAGSPPPQVPGQYMPNPGGPVPQDPPTAPDPNWPGRS